MTAGPHAKEAVAALFARAEELGELELVVHNIGGNVKRAVEATTPDVYRKVWELVSYSAFHCGKEAAERMGPRGRGTLIFTGATASLRGSAGFSAFASAMAAKRALAQSLACELGPKGVHVAHVSIDGPVRTPFVRELLGPERFEAASASEGLLLPEHIGEQCVGRLPSHLTGFACSDISLVNCPGTSGCIGSTALRGLTSSTCALGASRPGLAEAPARGCEQEHICTSASYIVSCAVRRDVSVTRVCP